MVRIRESRGGARRNGTCCPREAWSSGHLCRRAVWMVDRDLWGAWRRPKGPKGQRLDPGTRRAVRTY